MPIDPAPLAEAGTAAPEQVIADLAFEPDPPRSSGLIRTYVAGAFWLVGGTGIFRAASLVVTILLARSLGADAFGRFAFVQTTGLTFGTLIGSGLSTTATRYVPDLAQRGDAQERMEEVVSVVLLLAVATGVVATGLLALAAGPLARSGTHAVGLGPVLAVGSLIALFSAFNAACNGVLAGFKRFRLNAGVNVLAAAAIPVAIAGMRIAGVGGAIAGYTFALLFGGAVNFVAVRRLLSKRGMRVSVAAARRGKWVFGSFTMPALLGSAVVAPTTWIAMLVLAHARRHGFDDVAVFAFANQWRTILLFVPEMLAPLSIVLISERLSRGDESDARRTYLLALGVTAAVMIPPTLVLVVARDWVMARGGAGIAAGGPTLLLLLVATMIGSVVSPTGHVLAAAGRMWVAFATNLAWAVALTVACIAFAGQGSAGIAKAFAIAYGLHLCWTLAYAWTRILRPGLPAITADAAR